MNFEGIVISVQLLLSTIYQGILLLTWVWLALAIIINMW